MSSTHATEDWLEGYRARLIDNLKWLMEVREETGPKGVRTVANRAGITKDALDDILAARTWPRENTTVKLARALGVEPVELRMEPDELRAAITRRGNWLPFPDPTPATFNPRLFADSTAGSGGKGRRGAAHGRIQAPGALLHSPLRPARTRPCRTAATLRRRHREAA